MRTTPKPTVCAFAVTSGPAQLEKLPAVVGYQSVVLRVESELFNGVIKTTNLLRTYRLRIYGLDRAKVTG